MPSTCSGNGKSWPTISSRVSLTNSQPTPTDKSASSANSTMAIRRPVKPRRLRKPSRPSMSGLLDRAGEDVAGAAHRLDQFAVALDLLAQPADLHIDRAIERIGLPAARPVHQLLAREHTVGPREKAPEQIELGAGQRKFAAVGVRDMALVEIDAEGRVDQKAAAVDRRRFGSAQDRANARRQFARIERFWQIIVRAHLEADDAVDILALGRQHQDRHPRAGAQPPTDRQPVFARQHDVEHHEVRLAEHGAEAIERRAAVAHIDAKALAREIVAQQAPDLDIVLDDENMRALVHPNTLTQIPSRKYLKKRRRQAARCAACADTNRYIRPLLLQRDRKIIARSSCHAMWRSKDEERHILSIKTYLGAAAVAAMVMAAGASSAEAWTRSGGGSGPRGSWSSSGSGGCTGGSCRHTSLVPRGACRRQRLHGRSIAALRGCRAGQWQDRPLPCGPGRAIEPDLRVRDAEGEQCAGCRRRHDQSGTGLAITGFLEVASWRWLM